MAILAAIDENERSKRVVRIAHDLATTYGDTLIALHVVPQDDFEEHRKSLREIPEFRDFSMAQEAGSAEEFARRFVVETIEDVDRQMFEPRGRVGNIARVILGEAERVEPRYLVISGRRRSPAGKALFGNTAQEILLNADCPVVSRLSDT